MKRIDIEAKDWAERNSSPGIQGRDDLYEILIEVQAQGFEAGARWMRGQAVKKAANVYTDKTRRAICRDVSYAIAKIGEEEV